MYVYLRVANLLTSSAEFLSIVVRAVGVVELMCSGPRLFCPISHRVGSILWMRLAAAWGEPALVLGNRSLGCWSMFPGDDGHQSFRGLTSSASCRRNGHGQVSMVYVHKMLISLCFFPWQSFCNRSGCLSLLC